MRAILSAPQVPSDDTSEAAPPSQRMTLDIAAVASIAGLHDSRGHVPLDHCVPVRTLAGLPVTITRDEILVLLYVDGVASLKQIADETSTPLAETVATVFRLLSQGIVQVLGEDEAAAASQLASRDPE